MVATSAVEFLLLLIRCFRFCSDTLGSDPPLNAPKFVAGAKFVFNFDCETTWNNSSYFFLFA